MNAFSSVLKRNSILLGFALMFLFTWAIDLTLAAQANGWLPMIVPPWLGLFVGYGFVVAALLATNLIEGWSGIRALLKRYLIWRVGLIWYAVVLLGPALVNLTALGIAWWANGIAPDFSQPFVRKVPGVDPSLSLGLVALLWMFFEIFTNGEEIGWRGYILPRLLTRSTALNASLLLGVVWALWHLPKFWMGGVSEEAHSFPFWMFALNMVAQTILYTWVYLHTRGSLLLATLFHAAVNTAEMTLPILNNELALAVAMGLRFLWVVILVMMVGQHLTRRTPATGEVSTTQVAAPLA